MRIPCKNNLRPWYISPFEVLKYVGPMAYGLDLPPNLSSVHPIFHVYVLNRYHGDGDYIINRDPIVLDEYLQYEKEQITINEQDACKLRTKGLSPWRLNGSIIELRKLYGKPRRLCETNIPNYLLNQVLFHSFLSLFFISLSLKDEWWVHWYLL